MAGENDSPQKAAMREMMHDYLKINDISIKSGTDVNSVMRDIMSVLLEGTLDEELNEELGYSKYDHRNKDTDNSRNGHSQKTMHTSYGGMHVGENESAKFWLSFRISLKNRGVDDILIACVDGLTSFPQAIEAVYPKTEIQQCIIHEIRNSTKFVSYKDIKKLMADLKGVYAAPTEEIA